MALAGDEGHDGLITACYESSHSCGYAMAAGQDYRDTSYIEGSESCAGKRGCRESDLRDGAVGTSHSLSVLLALPKTLVAGATVAFEQCEWGGNDAGLRPSRDCTRTALARGGSPLVWLW